MKGEKLFRIIGLVDDDLIEAAEDYKPVRKYMNKVWMKWAAAACAVLIIGSSMWYLINSGIFHTGGSRAGGSGHAEGSVFMHYAGPILPLNAVGDIDGITASRSIDFDFTSFEDFQSDLYVRDHYKLTNNTAEDKTIEAIYPFISSIADSEKYLPTLTVNGGSVESKLLIGDYTGKFTGVYGPNGQDNTTYNLAHINSWEGYKALLEDGTYFKAAQNKKILQDQTVTVYTFHDVTYPEEYEAATLAIEFDLPEGSKVITYDINGASYDGQNHYRYSFSVGYDSEQKIIVLGNPPEKYTVQGYENGACKKEVNTITGTVRKETMQLSAVIEECLDDFMLKYGDQSSISSFVTKKHIYDAIVSMFQYTALGDNPKDRYEWMRLDDIISESYTMERVMYLTTQITIPAGQSVELESKFMKDASYDFSCAGNKENKGVRGYDMMTKLGSSLEFEWQKAAIYLPDTYEIIRQNFGFDIAEGITEVNLDMSQERYYLEIRQKYGKDK